MRKFNILMLGAIALFAASCEKEIEEAIPPVNEQGPIMTSGDVTWTVKGPIAEAQANPDYVLNLEDYNNDDNSMIPIVDTGECQNMPDGAKVTYQLQLSDSEDFKNVVTIDAIGDLSEDDPNLNYVAATDWNDAHIKLFGKSPKEKTAYYRIPIFVELEGSNYRYQSLDTYAAQGTIIETCMDQGFVIEDAYYFLSDATSWSLNDASAMSEWAFIHNNPDESVYDDPVFWIKVTVTNSNCYWKIAPQSIIGTDDWDAVLGPETNGDTAMEGMLVDTNAQAGLIENPGKYKITINMESMQYTIEQIYQPEYVYTPGGANGWDQLSSAWMQWYSTDDDSGYYYGVVPVSDGMKFCTETNWKITAGNFGGESEDAALSGNLVQGDAGTNINVPESGVYWCEVNYDKETDVLVDYKFVEITKVGLIGSFAASGWSEDVEMTKVTGTDDNDKPYVDYVATVTWNEGEAYKVRFNGGWDYSLGNSTSDLQQGDDIKVEESGTFKVTMHLLNGVPRLVLEKQ